MISASARWSVRTLLIFLVLAILLLALAGIVALCWPIAILVSHQYPEPGSIGMIAALGLAICTLFAAALALTWLAGAHISKTMRSLAESARTLGSGKTVAVPRTAIKEADEIALAIAGAADIYAQRTAALQSAHEFLRESEARFRLMADSAPVLIWVADAEGHATWFNLPWFNFTGRTLEGELGYGWTEGVHPKDLPLCLHTYRQALGRQESFSMEYRLLRRDGEYRWLLHQGVPRGDTSDAFAGYVGSCIDITERRLGEEKLFESEIRFRSTFELAAVGIAQVALDGRWLRVNDTLCAILGFERTDLLHLRVQDVTYPPDLEMELASARKLLAGNTPSYGLEKRYVRRDGSLVWVNLTGTLVRTPTGEPDYFIVVAEDIQRRKEAESALEEARESYRQHLEQQVAERTAALVAANRELQAFTYAASHDLKGPLGRINSFSTLLERSCRDRLLGDELLFLDFIRRNAMRLTVLIDDMLAHAQIDQHTLNPQLIDLRAVLDTVLAEKAEDILESKAQIHIDLPEVTVRADPLGLGQVLRNLVENALKYSAQANPPKIDIGGERKGEKFLLWIRDNGVGFDMTYHDQIFEIFRRLHTYDEFPGSGIGLALVKKAMEHMGGRVWAESAAGAGATFYLELNTASTWESDPAASAAAWGRVRTGMDHSAP